MKKIIALTLLFCSLLSFPASAEIITAGEYHAEQKNLSEIDGPGTKVYFNESLSFWIQDDLTEETKKALEMIQNIKAKGTTHITPAIITEYYPDCSRKEAVDQLLVAYNYVRRTCYGNDIPDFDTTKYDFPQQKRINTLLVDNFVDIYNENVEMVKHIVKEEILIEEGESYTSAIEKINVWMLGNLSYDMNYLEEPLSVCIKDRKGVCMQYSMFFNMCCDYCGIPCEVIVSNDGTHAWNKTVIDGYSYYTDMTWSQNIYERVGFSTAYLLKPYKTFYASHNF